MVSDPLIVAGFGFRGGATADSLADALDRAGGSAGVTSVATAADKARSPAFVGFSRRVSLPVRKVDPESLSRQQTATQSSASYAARSTGSVAEAAALAAAGPDAELIAPRVVSADGLATCALAKGIAG